MNSNNHNPGIVPGYYNPQQSKTEALDYQAFLGEGFIDPTQIPMVPGDTQRPVLQQNQLPANQVHAQESRAMPPIGASTQNYQREMQAIYDSVGAAQGREAGLKAHRRELESRNTVNKIDTITIPIVIELTINLNINHASSNIQQ